MADIYMPPASADSGSQGSKDPTLVSGQDPSSLFGIAISYSSGAGGSGGGSEGATSADPTNQPNQYPDREAISGVSLDGSGAPGSAGITATVTDTAGTQVTVTDPNYFAGRPGGGSGVQQITVNGSISGPNDWTAPQSNYPPAHPAPGTRAPTSTGAGQGSVRRGGNMRGQR